MSTTSKDERETGELGRKCPVCHLAHQNIRRIGDAWDVECSRCIRYRVTGPERLDLADMTTGERRVLSDALRAATDVGKICVLGYGFARRIVEDGWRIAPTLAQSSVAV